MNVQGEVKLPTPAIAMTPEGIRAFIGNECDTLQFGVEDQSPHEADRYTLTAHDLLGAFAWWDFPVYTADQLRQAVQEAVEAERERAARICERMVAVSAVSYETGSACAAAIRSGEGEKKE